MIRHILFWKYTDAVKAQHQEAEALKFLQNSVATMRGRIDGLLCIEIGLNLAGGDYDLIFYAELRDEQALQCFQQHPLHAAHRERCKDLVTARVCGRSAVVINKDAKNSKAAVSCQSLMLDTISRSDTIPAMDVRTPDADVGHEARIGRISDDAVFYLMSRGIPEEEARAMIVSGFADNVSKELPLEYAMEMNNLIRLEMKGSIG